ncbi:hypothetical protein BT63DRAFT_147476 [Microthyrium microscopicum]|uniref:DUF7730 domain-containing protein n=1 Tax=Microthyrium microscopicum TaxID=703497 RepID=A0A6A6UNU9_9PEZI|nr:hypothetical protein BT63DRAFT_147476 [Microthyrium microscopicum]
MIYRFQLSLEEQLATIYNGLDSTTCQTNAVNPTLSSVYSGQDQSLFFFKLPPELRRRIYRYLATDLPKHIHIVKGTRSGYINCKAFSENKGTWQTTFCLEIELEENLHSVRILCDIWLERDGLDSTRPEYKALCASLSAALKKAPSDSHLYSFLVDIDSSLG